MHSTKLRLGSLCVAGVALAACQRGQPVSEPAPVQRSGTYDFSVRQGDVSFDGLLHVRSDTMRIQVNGGTCWTDIMQQPSPERTQFRCRGAMGVDTLTLAFDNRNPERSSYWGGTMPRRVTRDECMAYGLDLDGQMVCVSRQSVSKEEKVSVSGTILLQRKKSSP